MGETNKAAVFTAPEKIEIMDLPIPEPGPGEILVRQKACAICTMEQRVYKGILKLPYPSCWGHEVSGIVEKVGPNSYSRLSPGDHVALGAPQFCGECFHCVHGREEVCMEKFSLPEIEGIIGIFGMAEYAVVETRRAFKISRDIPFAHSALTEPLACALQTIKKLQIDYGETVVVIGAGTMGMLNVMASLLRGVRVLVSEINPERREKALQAGADGLIDPSSGQIDQQVKELNDGRGADAVIVAIGNDRANQDALKMVDKHGRISLFASAHPPTPMNIDPNMVHKTSISLTGTTGKNILDLWQAASLISGQKVNLPILIEDTFPLTQADKAIEKALQELTFRTVLEM